MVLYRAEANHVTKVRTFTSDCDLDAGGTTFYWLTGVKPADSVAFLRSLVNTTADTMLERERSRDSAINAIAMHSDPAAQTALEAYLAPDQPEAIRRRVAYAMGWRGRAGYDVLTRILKQDADERVREAAIRALPETKQPDALQILNTVAKEDKNPRVRGEAIYSLARYTGTRAASTIQTAIESDPDRHVRRRAVSALTQLPPEQGIPMLISVARTTKDTDARREAMQFLSRSTDPRARQFIEQVLSK
jgi:HEAT repeat protein